MAEPNTAAAAIACSATAEASFKVAEICGRSARDEFVRKQVEQALLKGNLPFNHTVERAIRRAAVLAALNVLTPVLRAEVVAAANKGPLGASRRLEEAVANFENEAKSLRFDKANKKRGRKVLEDGALEDVDVREAVQAAVARLSGNGVGGDPLAIAVLDRICDPGNWAVEPARVQAREYLLPFFQGTVDKPSAWENAFALHFAQELKDDAALSTFLLHLRLTWSDAKADADADDAVERDRQAEEVLKEVLGHGGQISQAVQQLRSDINSLVAEQVRREEVRDWFIKEGMFVGEHAPERDGVFDRFHFRAEGFEFQGRTEEIEAVERDFLSHVDVNDEAEQFRWMALCGAGGTGKSRLAQRIVDLQRASGTFSCAGFATTETLSRTDFIEELGNRLPAPTLIVVDYAFAVAADLPAFMRRMASGISLLSQPVRVIVVVRRPDDRVLSDIAEPPRGGNDFGLKGLEVTPVASSSQTHSYGGAQARLTLEPLGDEDTVAIMRERMLAAAESGVARSEFDDPKSLLSVLRRFDERMRPLFACVVADALQRGQLPEADVDGSQEEARKTLFTAYMKEESLRVWYQRAQHLAPTEPDECVVRHVNLVRVVTCAGGVKRADLRDSLNGKLDGDTQEALPGFGRQDGGPNIHRRLLRSIVPVSNDDEIAPIQPDLLAECLLLADGKSHGSFTRAGEQGDSTNLWLSPHQAIELAWHVNPEQSAAFIRLAAQDFPGTLHKTRCLPATYNDVEAARAGARALRNICADIAADILPRLPTEAQMARLFDIVMTFDGSLVDWAWRDKLVYEYYGDTLFQVSQVAGFVLNSNTSLADAITVVGEIETAKEEEARSTGLSGEFDRQQRTQPPTSLGSSSNGVQGGSQRLGVDESSKPAPKALTELVLDQYRKLAKRAEPFVWDDHPNPRQEHNVEDRLYAERERYVRALTQYYTSVLWQHRNDPKEGGRVNRAMSELEITDRIDARNKVLARLYARPGFNEVATISALLRALIYAEWGSNTLAYRDALIRVTNAIDPAQVTVRGLTEVIKFADNQLISHSNVANQRTPESLTVTERSNMLADLEAIDRLLVDGMKYVSHAADTPRDDIHRWASALLGLHYIRTESELYGLLPRTNPSEDIFQIIERFGDEMQVTPQVLKGLVHACDLASTGSAPLLDLVERHFNNWMDKSAIDIESFRPRSVDIEEGLFRLAVGTPEEPSLLPDETAQRLLSWLGAEARGATLRAVIDICDQTNLDLGSHSLTILSTVLRSILEEVGLSGEETLAEVFLSLWARQLFDGETKTVVNDIEAFWSEGAEVDSILSRALAMRGYALLGAMSIDLPLELERLRIRLTSGDLEMGGVGSAVSSERKLARMHDEARAEALASLGALAIRRGGDPLAWSVTDQGGQQNKGSDT